MVSRYGKGTPTLIKGRLHSSRHKLGQSVHTLSICIVESRTQYMISLNLSLQVSTVSELNALDWAMYTNILVNAFAYFILLCISLIHIITLL